MSESPIYSFTMSCLCPTCCGKLVHGADARPCSEWQECTGTATHIDEWAKRMWRAGMQYMGERPLIHIKGFRCVDENHRSVALCDWVGPAVYVMAKMLLEIEGHEKSGFMTAKEICRMQEAVTEYEQSEMRD